MLTVRLPDDDATVDRLLDLAIRCGWLAAEPRKRITAKEKRDAARWFVARLVADTVAAVKR